MATQASIPTASTATTTSLSCSDVATSTHRDTTGTYTQTAPVRLAEHSVKRQTSVLTVSTVTYTSVPCSDAATSPHRDTSCTYTQTASEVRPAQRSVTMQTCFPTASTVAQKSEELPADMDAPEEGAFFNFYS